MLDTKRTPRIAIIGSGFSGLCLGIQLKQAGIDSFTIYEKSNRLGGTWRDNTYPGACCDVPAFAYCFSFEQKTDWSRKWAPHDEILAYMEHCATKYDVKRHIRFETEIADASFDESRGVWKLRTKSGEAIEAEVLVSGVGQLNRPYIPDIPGLDRFRGEKFHSARWNHAYDLTGKRVGVIGNAASAIQFIPQIAPKVEHLTIFQRSANWMLPRGDRPYTEREKWIFENVPFAAKLYRWWIWALLELRFPLFIGNTFFANATRKVALKNIEDNIRDPELRKKLVPDYPIGGKRILVSDDYYPTLNRQNVELVTSGIDHVEEDGVVTVDGRKHPLDVLILATGFLSTDFLAPMQIEGLKGRSLEAEWKDGARAYRGITHAGFPNFFMMYGPNTNLGHNSIIFMIECQTNYIVQAIKQLMERDLAWLDLDERAMEEYNRNIQAELERTVWAATPRSWYKTAAGRITNNWSGSTIRYWWTTRRFDAEKYHAKARAALAAPSQPSQSEPTRPAASAAA
ncbi:MAG TPA: NAD(P)/FAD-dependent oxidoreductase [Candidatus Binatia bacterium]